MGVVVRELKVLPRRFVKGGKVYLYGCVQVLLPRDLVGRRVKVVVLPAEERREVKHKVIVVKPPPCVSEEELVDVERSLWEGALSVERMEELMEKGYRFYRLVEVSPREFAGEEEEGLEEELLGEEE